MAGTTTFPFSVPDFSIPNTGVPPLGLGSSSSQHSTFTPSQIIEIAHESHMVIESHLGTGTYGKVYAVRHVESGRPYAMKTIPISSERRLHWARAEVKILEKIRDSGAYKFGLTLLKDVSIRSGHFCLFMDRMDGDLWNRMGSRQGKPFQLLEIKHIGCQLFTALGKLHSLGVIHADLKPENVLIAPGYHIMDTVQISDFGSSVSSKKMKDRRGDTLQSLFYRAPEVLFGLSVSEKIDVWSVGCILAELFVSHIFYPAADEIQLASFIATTQGLPVNFIQSLYWNKFYHIIPPSKMDLRSPVFVPKHPQMRYGIPDKRHRAYNGLNSIVNYGYNALVLGYATPVDLQFVRDLHMLMSVDSDYRCTADEANNLPFFQT